MIVPLVSAMQQFFSSQSFSRIVTVVVEMSIVWIDASSLVICNE